METDSSQSIEPPNIPADNLLSEILLYYPAFQKLYVA
jgi:hypothetical protein